jgi:hypothetical protein
VDNLEQRKDFINLMFIELVEFKGSTSPNLSAYFPGDHGVRPALHNQQGELRPIPLLVVVRAFVGLFFSFMITDILIAEQLPPEMRENALDHFVDIYLHGILRQDSSAEEAR